MKRLHRLLAPTLLASLLLAGCSEDPERLVASAKQFAQEGEREAALIELKRAIEVDPDFAEARFLLGKSLLTGLDAPAAVIEFRKAMDLGYAADEVVPELARAMFLQGESEKLLDEFGAKALGHPQARADLYVTLAQANASLGRREAARRALDEALKAIPDYAPAMIFAARLQAVGGDVEGALAALDRQLERSPRDAQAWRAKGDLLMQGRRDLDGALAAYRQAVDERPRDADAQFALMSALLAKDDLEGAKAQLEVLGKVFPRHPQTLFFATSVALVSGDLDKARDLGDQLLRISDENANGLQLVGMIDAARHEWSQAELHLGRALQLNPGLGAARRALASVYLQRSEPAKVLVTLQPLLERPDASADVRTLAARAHLLNGELAEAEKAFAAAAKSAPGDRRSQVALAANRALLGDGRAGVEALRSLAAGSDDTLADLPLITALMRRNDVKAAMTAIDALEKKQPDKPMAANLRARLLLQQGDKAGAEKAFRRALEIDPTFFPAASSLAQLARLAGHEDEAERIVDEFLKAAPTHTQALIASAMLKSRRGVPPEEILSFLDRAIARVPTDPALRLARIDYQMATRDLKGAVEAAQQAVAALPEDASLLDALGRAQADSGDVNQALATFARLAKTTPGSTRPHLRMAEVQWAAGQREAAIEALQRAYALDKTSGEVQRALIKAYLDTGRAEDALGVAREVRQQQPRQEAGYLFEGSVALAQRRVAHAIIAYREGLGAVPDSTNLATRLHAALAADGQAAEAGRLAAQWQRQHPGDAGFRSYLGDLALARKDYPAAERHYRDVLAIQPGNALALNNVAWLMATAGKPGAVALAEKAVALMPDRPALMDTLALALASEGRKAKAVSVMQQAVRMDERNPQLRLNLARRLLDAGDKGAAKAELQALAALGEQFPQHGEVAALLKTL